MGGPGDEARPGARRRLRPSRPGNPAGHTRDLTRVVIWSGDSRARRAGRSLYQQSRRNVRASADDRVSS